MRFIYLKNYSDLSSLLLGLMKYFMFYNGAGSANQLQDKQRLS